MSRRVKLRGAQRRQPARKGITLRERLLRAAPVALAGVLVCILIAGLIYLPRVIDGYPIRSVQVEGVQDSRRQLEVQTVLQELVTGENFFSLPLQKIYRSAMGLSWVQSAAVRREWPDSVVLVIEERVPVAVWNEDVLVSSSGEPFNALQKYATETLPRLSGPVNRLSEVMEYYHSMSKVLVEGGLRIHTLSVDSRLSATVTLDNGVLLMVDRDQYATKLRRFVGLYQQVLMQDSRTVKRVDLRYGDGIAVQWQDAETDSDERA